MKFLKYSLIILISFASLSAGGEKDLNSKPIDDKNSFEEFIKDKTANDIGKVTIQFEVSKKDGQDEAWEKLVEHFVACGMLLSNENQNLEDIAGSFTKFFIFMTDNKNNLSGILNMGAIPKKIEEKI